jgi:hypothetical protein
MDGVQKRGSCADDKDDDMTSITVLLDDATAEALRRLAALEKRSEEKIVCTAIAAYAQTSRPKPQGAGKCHSGRSDVSARARDIIRDDVKEGRWP